MKYMAFFMLPSKIRTRVRVKQRGYVDPAFVEKHKDSVIADKFMVLTQWNRCWSRILSTSWSTCANGGIVIQWRLV